MVGGPSCQALVTGAAGFIGSHLTDGLLRLGWGIVGFDNLSTGDITNLAYAMENSRFRFVEGDLLDVEAARRVLGECEMVFHLAADPEVRTGAWNPDSHFRQNLTATFNLLEAIRRRGDPTRLVFASTSTVYGEASVVPTPEDYSPLLPTSVYGATKLGCEALAASYTELLPLRVVIFRLANIVGSRGRHGVVYDFMNKLRKNPKELEVLGDGTQSKSYLLVEDCLNALLMVLDETFWQKPVGIYNVGSEDRISVLAIARIVANALGLKEPAVRTISSLGGKAWPGDVKTMQLDISRIKRLGWRPKRNSEQAIWLSAKESA